MNEYLFHLIFIIYSSIIYIFRLKIANKLGVIDYPDNIRKTHTFPIPSMGGIIIFPYIISSIFYINFLSIIKLKILLLWIFLLSSFFLIGLIDDRINLNAKTKTFILLFILFITIPLDQGFVIEYLSFKNTDKLILLNQASIFFTIFCIYFFYNSLNFSDGYNGISITLSLYILITLIIVRDDINIYYNSCIIGLILLLIPNIFSKIFMGNSGVSLVSIILSILIIDSLNKDYIYFDEIILILFLPAIDTSRITIERIIQGRSPFQSDKLHFHHLLNKLMDKRFIFMAYLFFSAIPYLISITILNTYYSFVISILIYFSMLYLLKKINDRNIH